MLRLLAPLLESVLQAAVHSPEFRAWSVAELGPSALASLEEVRQALDRLCRDRGW